MKTGIQASFQNLNNLNKLNNKIPEYAREYKKEYLFIRGLNKEFEYFINKLYKLNDGLFESNIADRIKNIMKIFLRGQEKGKIKDISNFIIPSYDDDNVCNLIFINKQFELYKLRYDAFCDDDFVYGNDSDSDDDSVGEYLVHGKPYPGFKEFYDIFKIIFSQIRNEDSDSDSDSDSDIDSDSVIEEFDIILPDSDDDSDDL